MLACIRILNIKDRVKDRQSAMTFVFWVLKITHKREAKYDTQLRTCKRHRVYMRLLTHSAKRRRATIKESGKLLTHSRHDRQNQQHAAHDYHLPSWSLVAGVGITTWPVISVEDKRATAAVVLFPSARGLSHTPTVPKGGETGAGIWNLLERPRRLGIYRTRLPADWSADRSSLRISGFFFLPLSLPSDERADERAYESRSSNAAPLFRAASAPWTSQNVCYGHEERKVTAGIYARRARYRLSSWHSHLSSRAGNKEGSLGAIPTTAHDAHHLGTVDVRDHQGVGTRWWTPTARAFLAMPRCTVNPESFSLSYGQDGRVNKGMHSNWSGEVRFLHDSCQSEFFSK